ncbi:valine--tRNA ligase [Nostoc sp. ChiQUE01b]|uniref:valine--tRNA ligase n=1 Tax=Nostoc sp. ChiQUE01b TaxID=3075376 RepID=UPI002AD277F1|nr:valine--tRNA ligase [Nostoc sp. ChiQUE01b]MDZ8259841.1 valine--tRNA ligase [Nostoc sp. ChiQUE01b]
MTATIPNLPSLYDPFSTEAKWQKFWEDNQVYKADPNKGGEPYCIVIPPPNVTGSLHMGHAFESALIDTLVRYHRMQGRNTLWLPGTDHASIAVHTMLEKQLKTEGKTRYELGRENFLERAWQWKAESEGTILNQLRRLGVSVDWSRERFTLDEGLSKAVVEAFTRLYEEGLIYRGEYLVNWCPASQSAVSDVEVENQEVNGNLWHLGYPLTDGSGFVEVATTRPETMLGDTAVAVNPNDDRYKHLIGKTVTLPILQREIPIIGDEFVDPTFGTGCVKVTPAHDLNDFDMGKRHNLPLINIMNKDGTLNANAGEFQGQDRFVARKNVVSRLEADGFLVKIEDYKHTVPYSDRGKVPIEPLLSTQWFVKIRPLADNTLEFLDQQNSPEFVPQRWTKVYRDWLVKLTDWCISRQLWWGHRIPAWYAVSETDEQITDNTPFVVAKSETEAWKKAKAQFGENVKLEQDPDVLDTWFSSGLWPFSTLGWPEQTQDLATYYPTTTLVTGFDIIFFWVARMTMMAGHFTGQMPFQTVYIHGLVLDEKGQKMGKSKGNGIDPLLLIDKYGTDALRYTLIREVAGAGQNIRLEYDRKKDESASVEASRNFANKLWNAARFVMMNLDGLGTGELELGSQSPAEASSVERTGVTGKDSSQSPIPNPSLELSDRWIISRYHQVIKQTTNYIDNYGLGEAAKGLYEFIWGDFCDQYIELVKSRLQADANPVSRRVAQQTLGYILEGIMKLLHPFMPHITEEIWQTLTQQSADSSQTLPLQIYPQVDANLIDPALEEQFELLIGTIRTIRNLRAEADIKPGVKVTANLQTQSEKEREILTAGQDYIKDLAKVKTLTITEKEKSQTVAVKKPQRALKTIGLIIVAIVFGRVGLAAGNAIDDIPIVGTFFELVGFGYIAWFVSQNLLTAQARQSLWRRFFPEKELEQSQESENAIAGVIGTIQVLIPLSGVVDIEAVRAKLEKSLSKAEAEIQSLSTRLNNPSFVDKARADVVQGARDALAEAQKQAEILRDRLCGLG